MPRLRGCYTRNPQLSTGWWERPATRQPRRRQPWPPGQRQGEPPEALGHCHREDDSLESRTVFQNAAVTTTFGFDWIQIIWCWIEVETGTVVKSSKVGSILRWHSVITVLFGIICNLFYATIRCCWIGSGCWIWKKCQSHFDSLRKGWTALTWMQK